MTLKIMMWNVQHGSAAYIQTPNGKQIAIDMGASADCSPFQHLYQSGVRKLDHVTITHPHLDHIEDILNFDKLNPITFQAPALEHITERVIRGGNKRLSQDAEAKLQKYLEIRRRYRFPVPPVSRIDLPENTGNVSIKTFQSTKCSTENINNHSIVTALEYCGVKVLIPGDNESPSWEELLMNPNFVSTIKGTDVLVAAHHGREAGFHNPLFNHFHPRITVISDGSFVDTSATSQYDNVTQGWNVFSKRNRTYRQRKCVTTRNDGTIEIDVGLDNTGRPTLDVIVN